MIEFLTKTIRHVTRSTFAAELHAACDSVDLGILIMLMLHEIQCGLVSKSDARVLRDKGGYAIPMSLQIDAMTVFAAVTATFIKAPAEKSLLSHVQFLRELLDSHVCRAIIWCDTRDMYSDGMTKGVIERDLLHLLMGGRQDVQHECKLWSSKIHKSPEVTSTLDIDSHLEDGAALYYTLSYRHLDM